MALLLGESAAGCAIGFGRKRLGAEASAETGLRSVPSQLSPHEGPGYGAVSGYGPWGGHPGNTPDDVQSGIGCIGNALLLLDAPQKTVVRAAFRPLVKPATDATHRHSETITAGFLRLMGNDDVRGLPSAMLGVLRG